jgi:nicotinate phosphoribosyltransferase
MSASGKERDERSILRTLADVRAFQLDAGRLLYSATHEEILNGATSDVYFQKGYEVLARLDLLDTPVVAEIFPHHEGILAGVEEALALLAGKVQAVWALEEGQRFSAREVVMRIEGRYGQFGIFETAVLGILSQSSGWATAARACREAVPNHPVSSFGARHVHPAVASVMDRAARVGGLDGVSTILGAKLCGLEPQGTIPHAVVLIAGDTLPVAEQLAALAESDGVPAVVLVDTFKDEAEEALRVARALGPRLKGVRIDTPAERGGVTVDLVRELRARLDLEGFRTVEIFCSGSLNPERLQALAAAGASAFGVGHYISSAPPIDMTMDLKEVAGRPLAKRGRIPGRTVNPRLRRAI